MAGVHASRTRRATEGGAGGDGETAGADEEKKKQVSAKKATAAAAAAAAGTAHLEENVDKLNLTKLDVSFDVDPLFHRTSAKVRLREHRTNCACIFLPGRATRV